MKSPRILHARRAAGLLLLAGATAFAGAQQPVAPRSAADYEPERIQFEGDALELGIGDVVLATLASNLDIRFESLDVAIASDNRVIEQAIYDPVLSATIQRTDTNMETGSASGAGASMPPRAGDSFETREHSTSANTNIEQLLPTGARLEVGFENTRRVVGDSRADSSIISPGVSQRAYIAVRQPLLKNFGPYVTNRGINIARLNEQIASEQFRQQLIDRLAEVMTAYWDLVFSIKNLDVQRTSLESALEVLKNTENSVRVGTLAPFLLRQAEAEVAQRRNNIIIAKSNILAAQDQLLRLMNWEEGVSAWSRPITPVDRPFEDEDEQNRQLLRVFNDQPFLAETMQFSPLRRIADLSREVSVINRRSASWQRLPELNLFGELAATGFDSRRGDAFDDIEDLENDNWVAGVELKFPLPNRRARAEFRRSEHQLDQADLVIAQVEQNLMTQARAATRQIRTAQDSIEASRAQVTAAQAAVDAERNRREYGESTVSQVLDRQEDLANAELNLIRAQTAYQRGLIELERTRGTLLESLGVRLEGTERSLTEGAGEAPLGEISTQPAADLAPIE